ncbi:hypothetical protein PYCCODRAFT_450979 [Trametes coccinea BRFM310]|uniref:Uncharacterized protein n=1 Tax=Trametes coccinea (strain BRFM310) TaxID=1353009 RepID=A0A1Y2IL40_TRAC3|nr:hypothetical protein PYCCODRAFT_450979 [Trametes coccinea BRFM310]
MSTVHRELASAIGTLHDYGGRQALSPSSLPTGPINQFEWSHLTGAPITNFRCNPPGTSPTSTTRNWTEHRESLSTTISPVHAARLKTRRIGMFAIVGVMRTPFFCRITSSGMMHSSDPRLGQGSLRHTAPVSHFGRESFAGYSPMRYVESSRSDVAGSVPTAMRGSPC